MTHSPTCTGCPHCNAEMRSLLSMSRMEYSRWLTAQDAKWRPAHAHSDPRPSLPDLEVSDDAYAAPDPYAAGLQVLKAALPVVTAFALDYKLQRYRQLETGYHDTAHHDARAAAAAERLGVPVADLRMAVDDATDYSPPDSYAAGIKALQENQR